MKQKNKTNNKKTNIKSQNGTRTQWHPAFYAAARLELRENKDDLQFFSEYDINTKPITIDVLIIRKNPGAPNESAGTNTRSYFRAFCENAFASASGAFGKI